jgi:hypothetical protein
LPMTPDPRLPDVGLNTGPDTDLSELLVPLGRPGARLWQQGGGVALESPGTAARQPVSGEMFAAAEALGYLAPARPV